MPLTLVVEKDFTHFGEPPMHLNEMIDHGLKSSKASKPTCNAKRRLGLMWHVRILRELSLHQDGSAKTGFALISCCRRLPGPSIAGNGGDG